MKEIIVDVTVSETYMKEMKSVRTLANKESNYSGKGDFKTILVIASDLVVCRSSAESAKGSQSKILQEKFIHCGVNVEMKRFRRLIGSENKSELTQLSAESYARKSKLQSPRVLYSVVTDCCAFYVLCHLVKPAGKPDDYWVSRQETDPERVVSIFLWLLRHSRGKEDPGIERWRVPTAADGRSTDNADDDKMARDEDTGFEKPGNDPSSHGKKRAKPSSGEPRAGLRWSTDWR